MSSVYSVKQVSSYVRQMFEQDLLLPKVTVRGEISNLKDHPSGHVYFTLKDSEAQLSAVMFAGSRKGLKCSLRDGMEVLVTGQITIYEAGGRYQLYARIIEAAGEGDLFRRFLELKERLQDMGMFDPSFKKPVPKYPRTVGIVTASSGAALHDILQISRRRDPSVQLILAPAKVQGEGAPESIIRAIEKLDRIHPDVMIVGRGGGSAEDLWAFNDEGVARAIFDADTPVISAVGHEVDFTIADFVADLRAPTPSAAAELAVCDRNLLLSELKSGEEKLCHLAEERIRFLREKLDRELLRLRILHPRVRLQEHRMRLTEDREHLDRRINELFSERKNRFLRDSERLDGLSPLRKLRDGYGYITGENGPLRSVGDVSTGDRLVITLSDGKIRTEVIS